MTQPTITANNSTDNLVLRQDFDTISRITLNNPTRYNPLSQAMLVQLQSTFDELAEDDAIRVIILAANGKAFCAGHDLKEIRGHSDPHFAKSLFADCNQMMLTITRLPQPVIAQVQGIATAAGCQLVANCDLAIASTEAKFAVSGINYGLYCSTPSVALSRNVSRKTALEMLLTGDFIDAEMALSKGLINHLTAAQDLEYAAIEYAHRIANKPREVLALGKRLFYEQIDAELAEAYHIASERMACNLSFPSAEEGIDAFIEKRKPNWHQY